MLINEYQEQAHEFAKYGESLNYPFVGLAEEAGEACGKLAKFLRKNGRFPVQDDREFVNDLKKELGDVCWMVAECATIFGITLEDVMEANIEKLNERNASGTIVGSGDTNKERLLRVDIANAKFHLRKLIEIANESIERDGIALPEAVEAQRFLEALK